MAEIPVVVAAKGIYYAPAGDGLPGTVDSSINWTASVSEVQTITITGTPTAGGFKITYRGVPGAEVAQETGALTYDDVFGDVDAALEALAGIGVADVTCAGGALPGTAITVTFATLLADAGIIRMLPTSVTLTGGTTPTITIVRTTRGTAGWTEIEDVEDVGVEIVMEYSGKPIKPLGRIMPTHEPLTVYGAQSVKFQTYDSTEAKLALALPDADTVPAYLTGNVSTGRAYRALAVYTDNCVWYFPRVSAVGNTTLNYENEDFTHAPFEFKVFEENYEPQATSNWRRYAVTS